MSETREKTTDFAIRIRLSKFNFIGKIAASGNIMSLLDNDCQLKELNSDFIFHYLFAYSDNLVSVPSLPATKLSKGCYASMFYESLSLSQAPQLPATSLASGCYTWIYYGCSNLNYVEVAFDQWPSDSTTVEWLDETATQGTFVCPEALADERGTGRIPEGWTKTSTPVAKSATSVTKNPSRQHSARKAPRAKKRLDIPATIKDCAPLNINHI